MNQYPFDDLEKVPLTVGSVYKGGNRNTFAYDPLHKIAYVGNRGGFRKLKMSGANDFALVVIYTTGTELEWPNFLDNETGIFRYYGDNRTPRKELHDTKAKGNKLLADVFRWLDEPENIRRIPPFLIFEKSDRKDVRFLGLAVPGTRRLSKDKEIVAFWRTYKGDRFQNYEAYFTVLDLAEVPRNWLEARRDNLPDHEELAPKVWKHFMEKGRSGIEPLESPNIDYVPSRSMQLPSDKEGQSILQTIRDRYADEPTMFENCAVEIIKLMDSRLSEFFLTRPWRDGGFDASCVCRIGVENSPHPLKIRCAIEAKLYSDKHGIGVRQMSRLISRIKYREFGMFITTSYVDAQAYREVRQDGHPILMLTAKDITEILIHNGINTSTSMNGWTESTTRAVLRYWIQSITRNESIHLGYLLSHPLHEVHN